MKPIIVFAVTAIACFIVKPLHGGWETSNPFVGVAYSKLRDSDVHPILDWSISPLGVDVMEIDLNAEGISFTSTPPNGDASGETDRQTTMNFMLESDTQIAINTVFYDTSPTDCLGVVYSDGVYVSSPYSTFSSINISPNNEIELFSHWENRYTLHNAFSGYPVIVQNSTVVDHQSTDRHPRTAAGYNAVENKLILMTVDGRSSSSLGVTLKELGKLMANFGATWALNLDGGGSTQMTMNASTPVYVNSPSETYRAVAANLGVRAIADNTYHVFADFEHGNRATFEYDPGYSGSSYGFVDSASYLELVDTTAGAGQGALKVSITDDVSVPGEWFARIISGPSATRGDNTVRDASGYVGFMAKTTDANTYVSLALDDPNTGDRGLRKELISDGQWHAYQWNIDNDAHWESWTSAGDGGIDNADFTLDSLQIWGTSDATVYLDQIAHRATGPLFSTGRKTIAQHLGGNNPLTEDVTPWTLDGGGPTAGAVIDDQGSGMDAWSIDDNADGELSYMYFMSAEEASDMRSKPWTLSTRLRVADIPDECDSSIAVRVADGAHRWQAMFGSEEDGDPIVSLLYQQDDSTVYTAVLDLDGLGSGYHGYEWKADSDDGSVDFYVDGVKKYANWFGTEYSNAYIAWGSGNKTFSGQGNYNLIQLTVGGEATLDGDLNEDGFVDGDDLDIIRSFWGRSVTAGDLLSGDPSGDGFVGGDDLDIVRANWGQGTPPAPSAVPEPAAWFLFATGMLGLTACRWRTRDK